MEIWGGVPARRIGSRAQRPDSPLPPPGLREPHRARASAENQSAHV
jgi:hypothetical protein